VPFQTFRDCPKSDTAFTVTEGFRQIMSLKPI
jgi:hypothetical protein